jgi:hypothetical protein
MLRTALCTVSALAFLASAPAAGQEARAGKSTIRAKSILGATINISGVTSVGTVEDIVLTDEGVVEYLIVGKDGKLVTLPWEAAKFDYEKRQATVAVTREQYQRIPTYTAERYPDFYAPAYRGEVYKYYGLKPGQQRRLDRRLDRRP